MDPRTTERVERWDSRPFSNGYDGLSDLAAREFSGAVTAAGTWLFMLNGRVVGIVDGTIEDFDGATGTTYEAPDPALPLLCSMEETGGETRAKYYTNETPLEEVDGTLSSGSFTGYVELSEGVLSGDYYAVYYGGRRMAAAYIGNAERLLTGEEAFERAADEVGIYEVIDVDVDVTDVPGSEESSPTETEMGTGTETETGSAGGETGGSTAPSAPTDTDSDAENGRGSTTPSSSTPTPTSSGSSEPITDTDAETEPATEIETAHGDTGGDSKTESRSESASEPVSESEPEPASGPDSDPKPDSTLENVTSGITTSDERSVESTPPGITDDLSAPLADEVTGESEPEPESPSESESTSEADVVSEAEAKPESPSDREDESSAPSTTDDETGSTTDTVDLEADRSPSSAPDPDDLEAAAEELSESGVPWSSGSSDSSDSSEESDSSSPTADEIDVTFDATADADESAAELEERFKQEEQWRETRSIPSIDPDKTADSAAPPSKRRGAKNQRSRGRSRSAAGQSRTEGSSGARSGSRPGSETNVSSASESAPGTGTESGSGDESRSSSPTNAEPTDRGTQSASSRQNRGRNSGQQSQTDGATQRETTGARSKSPDDTLESDMLEREDKIDRLTQQLDDLEQRRDELETKAADLERERDRLQSENEELTETVERLESRIDELESELERVRSADATGAMAESAAADSRGTKLSPQQALAGTNLFVRYGSKSQPTLQAAHDDDADATSVNSNLLLEHHTQFDDADVSVGGEPYEEFLTSTMEYQFVDWLTGTLLYEIRDTGHGTSLGDLYDVIPRIDRAELHASISLEDDDTDEVPDQVTFDVVAFDKRGTPLVAANLNDSRDPATREMLIDLEETASAVNANFPDLGAAMVVTSSYFEPGALEIAEQATSGGFLSRGSKLSYVNLSRKQGYHMCLVESRSGGFHMNVPEL